MFIITQSTFLGQVITDDHLYNTVYWIQAEVEGIID